jgi:hypothetical protein
MRRWKIEDGWELVYLCRRRRARVGIVAGTIGPVLTRRRREARRREGGMVEAKMEGGEWLVRWREWRT